MSVLSHFQLVELAPAHSIHARVIGLDRRQVALQPVNPVDALWLSAETHDVLMLFTTDNRRMCFKGSLYTSPEAEELGFVVTDQFFRPAERSSRVALCAPVRLQPLAASGEPDGAPVDHQTAEIGADGLVLEPGCPVLPGTVVTAELLLPEQYVPVTATAVVEIPAYGRTPALRFVAIAQDDRSRVHRHVVDHLRAEVKRRHAAAKVSYVW